MQQCGPVDLCAETKRLDVGLESLISLKKGEELIDILLAIFGALNSEEAEKM